MNKFCLLLFAVVSVYGKVVIKHEGISNLVSGHSNIVKVKKWIGDNIIPHIEEPATTDSSKKTCHNVIDIDNNVHAHDNDNDPCDDEIRVDNGTALLLSPYIEEGRLEEARNASRVDPTVFLGFESYSGFLTVDKEYKSHLFFWYFPSLTPTNDTPWIIWLQGGPGASSLTGLFDEIGPFNALPDGILRRSAFTWLQNHSLVFIDNPVGTGFSFTEHTDGYATDMATYGRHLYLATKQLVQIFPELRMAPLYIAGESYAGKYVPTLGMEIHRHRDLTGSDIHLKGLIIGNAYVDPEMISQLVRPLYYFGLLEREQIDVVQPLIDALQSDIANNRSIEAKRKWNSIVSVILSLTHQQQIYNFLRDEVSFGSYINFLRKSEVKRALHVGDIDFNFLNVTVNTKLAPDFLSSTKAKFEELLEHYRVLAFCGQLDQMLPCAVSAESYRNWKWSKSGEFLNSTRLPYILDSRLAGYFKSGGGMTWAVVRGAGHMVPQDAPAAALHLVTHWTHSQPLPTVHRPHTSILIPMVKNNNTIVYL